jgi:predicted transcriptional regulator
MNTIQHIRKRVLDVSQSGLAEIAGTTQASVSRWEAGELQPDLEHLRAIRDAVRKKGVVWDDAWFFDAPKEAAQ